MDLADAPLYLASVDLQKEIRKYEYRDWILYVFDDPYEGPRLYIIANVPDAYDLEGKRTIQLRAVTPIPPIPSAGYFQEWLSWRLRQMEIHESLEHLRYEGRIVRDPHDVIEPVSFARAHDPQLD